MKGIIEQEKYDKESKELQERYEKIGEKEEEIDLNEFREYYELTKNDENVIEEAEITLEKLINYENIKESKAGAQEVLRKGDDGKRDKGKGKKDKGIQQEKADLYE